ncbi:MAG: DNA polymerase, partial [Proteobacteria bacterium]|nr:DNA polymerase [Pseudomonadota bacterium]
TAAPPPAAPVSSGAAEYVCLRTRAELDRVVAAAMAAGRVALHLEADGDDEMTAALTGAALATAPGRAWFVAVAGAPQQELVLEAGPSKRDGLAVADLVAALKPLAEGRGTLKVAHDAKRAVKLLARVGVTLAPVDDTLLLSFVLGGGRDDHGLGPVAARMADFDAPDRKSLLGSGKSAVPFAAAAEDVAMALACGSADAVLRAHTALRSALLRERLVAVFEMIERPLIPVLAEMEQTGVRIDPAALAKLSAAFAERMLSAEQEAHRLAGREFNVASPKQLGEVLFDDMGLPGGRKTRTGAWSTDADALDMLAADGHALPAAVLDWRLVAKLRSTYTETLAREINPATGRVHTTYGMAGAATGRLASMNPNLQNIPVRTEEGRSIRRAFVADRGHVLVSADYSQIELRLLAQLAGIDSLAAAFRDGIDIHALTASDVFGVAIDGMDAETRRRAKAINFGIIYGISPFGLARQLGIPQSAAKEYIGAYFDRYPGIRAYMDRARDFARRHGYVITWSGRRIHIPGINDKNHAHRAFSERAAINAPLQGSAADIMKRALVRMHRALERAELPARMLLSVHDEILFEVRESAAADLRALAKREMEAAAQLDVPLTVETGAGPNWDEAH